MDSSISLPTSWKDKVQPLVRCFAFGALGVLPPQKALNSSRFGHVALRHSCLASLLAGLRVVALRLSAGVQGALMAEG